MNYNEAKKEINKLNARLKALKKLTPESYDFAKEQLNQIMGLELTKSGKISTAKKKIQEPYDKAIGAATAAIPTATEELDYIKRELGGIDKHRAKLYGAEIPERTKAELVKELAAKRHFDVREMQNKNSFDESYEAWETHEVPFDMTNRQVELSNLIDEKLGKGRKGIKSYAELMEIQMLMDEYFETTF